MALKINHTITIITRIVGWGLILIILGCFLKVYIWEKSYYKNQSATPRSDSVAVITKLPQLQAVSHDEISKEEYDGHQVEAKNPRYLIIERLHVESVITKGKVTNDGQLQYPSNLNAASWYSGSSKPGGNGAILISGIGEFEGHEGIFKNLDSLENGDKIKIQTGDNSEFIYTVKSVSISSNSDAEDLLPKAEQRLEGVETLSLISVSDNSGSFIIVRATKDDKN